MRPVRVPVVLRRLRAAGTGGNGLRAGGDVLADDVATRGGGRGGDPVRPVCGGRDCARAGGPATGRGTPRPDGAAGPAASGAFFVAAHGGADAGRIPRGGRGRGPALDSHRSGGRATIEI